MNSQNKYLTQLSIIIFSLFFSIQTIAKSPYILNIKKQSYGGASRNWSIRGDELGYIYIANDHGLLEFDGVNWRLYKTPQGQAIKSLYIYNNDLIYTGNNEDFGKWERDESGNFIYTSLSKDIPQKEITYSEFWQTHKKDDAIYFQSFKQIYRYKDGKVEPMHDNKPILFLLPINNELWCQVIGDQLYKVEGLEYIKLPNTELIADKIVRSIHPITNNRYLIGTANNGIYIYDGKQTKLWASEISEQLIISELNCMIEKEDGNYLFGTILDGIYETTKNGKITNHYSAEEQLANNTILSMYETKNSIWVGCDQGVSFMQYDDNLSHFKLKQNTIGAVHSVCIWNNKLFISTNQGIYYLPESEFQSEQSLRNSHFLEGSMGQCWKLAVIDNRLFCCHNRGLLEIDKNLNIKILKSESGFFYLEQLTLYNEPVVLESDYTNITLIRENGDKLILNNSNCLVQYAYVDHLNNLWIKVPSKGLYKYKIDKNWKTFEVEDINKQNNLPATINLNMIKLGGRIIIADNNTFYTYDEIDKKIIPNKTLTECLHSVEDIKNIINIDNYHHWIIDSKVIYKFFYDGNRAEIVFQYSLNDYDLSIVDRFENISNLNDSVSAICLTNGFLLYDSNKPSKLVKPNKPKILRVSGANRNGVKTYYKANYDSNYFIIEPSSSKLIDITIFNPDLFYQKEHIEYRLKSNNSLWTKLLQSNTIRFEGLPSGIYEVEIRSCNSFGECSEAILVTIRIKEQWYFSPIAIIGYICLSILIALLIWKMILKRYKNQYLKKAKAAEHKRLIEENKQLQDKNAAINAELFTQANLTLRSESILREVKNELNDHIHNNPKRDINRLYKQLTKLLDRHNNHSDNWEVILVSFEEKHPNFFNRLKELSPDLTPNDLKICVLLRLNFDTKEIAQTLSLSTRTIDNTRSKLRKKLNIPAETNLTHFLIEF